jgi:DNA (cytosine-5)-methyltransferase 1
VAENVPGLLSSDFGRFFGNVLRDLATCGYDAEWDIIPAATFGAPHRRDRIFIVAHTNCSDGNRLSVFGEITSETIAEESTGWFSDWTKWGVTDGQGNRRIRCIPDSGICGANDGIPSRMDRLRCLGNAVVPQIAEWIGRRIVEADV